METAIDVTEATMNWGWVGLFFLGILIFLAFVCYGISMLRLFFKI